MGWLIVVIIVGLFYAGALWLDGKIASDSETPEAISENKTDSSPSTPKPAFGNCEGIPELIRQQEQTNKHLQKLIHDFLWFRIAIIFFFLFGSVGVVVKWS